MSQPPTRGAGADASSQREVQQPNDGEPPSRPTRNAPRIFFDGTIPYWTNRNSTAAAAGNDEIEAIEDTQRVTTPTTQSTAGTPNCPPRKNGRTCKTNVLQAKMSATALTAAQLRQGRIDQTKSLQEVVNKILETMKRQEELAEERHDELLAEMQELRT